MRIVPSIRFGLITGVISSLIITLVFTAWEWIDNPGGIFRGAEGTNWSFVFDTAMSWFAPALVYIAPLAVVGHVLWRRRKRSL